MPGHTHSRESPTSTDEVEESIFGSHCSRERVEDISYGIVKKSLHGHRSQNEGGGATKPPLLSQGSGVDSGNITTCSSVGGSDSDIEIATRTPNTHQDVTRAPQEVIKVPQEVAKMPSSHKLNSRRLPPKPPAVSSSSSHTYATVDLEENIRKKKQRNQAKKISSPRLLPEEEETPPPIPARPIITTTAPAATSNRKNLLSSSSSPNLLEVSPYEEGSGSSISMPSRDNDTKLQQPKIKEPIYDIIPDKLVVKKQHRARREYEEIILPEHEGDKPRLWVPPEKEKQNKESEKADSPPPLPPPPLEKRSTIPIIPNRDVVSRLTSITKAPAIEDLRENWFEPAVVDTSSAVSSLVSPQMRKKAARSFSTKRTATNIFPKRGGSFRFKNKLTNSVSDTDLKRKIRVRHCEVCVCEDVLVKWGVVSEMRRG